MATSWPGGWCCKPCWVGWSGWLSETVRPESTITSLRCGASIRTYPLAARPARIAANLSMDAFKTVYRERQWLRQDVVTPWPPHTFRG